MELVTFGSTFDVPAPVTGRLCRIDKPLDTTVGVGDILGWSEPEPQA